MLAPSQSHLPPNGNTTAELGSQTRNADPGPGLERV